MAGSTAWAARSGLAQGGDGPSEPLQCWWRTTAPNLRVGQPISVVLTCAAVDTPSLSAIVDETKLGPEAIQLSPFEVLGGTRAADQLIDDHRFFQREYRIRLVNDTLFGEDVPLPPVSFTYRLRSRVGDGPALEGVEKTYELPLQSLRVQSLVAADASDIRDASPATFAALDAETFHASMLVSAGNALLGLGGVLAVLALSTVLSGRRTPPATAVSPLSDRAVLRCVSREFAALSAERQAQGWSPERVRRALAALRVAGAHVLAQGVAQHETCSGTPVEGALLLRKDQGHFVVLSGAVTAEKVSRARAAAAANGADAVNIEALDDLHLALSSFTRAGYGPGTTIAEGPLDEALRTAETLAGSLLRATGRFPQMLTAASSRLARVSRRVSSR